jgi:hypothetical protein
MFERMKSWFGRKKAVVPGAKAAPGLPKGAAIVTIPVGKGFELEGLGVLGAGAAPKAGEKKA